jgi:hypothetical protein
MIERIPSSRQGSAATGQLGQDPSQWSNLSEVQALRQAEVVMSTNAESLTAAFNSRDLERLVALLDTWAAHARVLRRPGVVHGRRSQGGDAQVETTCGQCHVSISLAFRAGSPERNGPERLWLADGGADVRGSFCTPTVLLCGDEHGAAWAAAQRGRGRLFDLAEAARLGGIDWAGCGAAARRLS